MNTSGSAQSTTFEVSDDLTLRDLRNALVAGWSDFCKHPVFGLFFAAIFALAGAALTYVTVMHGELSWLIPAAAGFPILAPFAAVGLYEVSRRRDAGITMTWGSILGAVRGRGDEQILSMGVIIFVAFGFWIIVAHVIFSIALVESGSGTESLAFLTTQAGLIMLIVGSVVGAIMAFTFYTITVMSLPMLVDREVDFLTAAFASIRAVRQNKAILIVWAALISVLLFVAMIPLFLGLFIALPVLGHATWHLYCRTIQ